MCFVLFLCDQSFLSNDAVASTNIPTTLTDEPKKRGRPKDTDEAKATKKAAKEIQKNKV